MCTNQHHQPVLFAPAQRSQEGLQLRDASRLEKKDMGISAGEYSIATDERVCTHAAHLVGRALPGLEVSTIDVHLVLTP